MDPIRIDDPRDSRVAAYLDIRERDLAGRQGRFVAEGKVVLDLLLSSGRFGAESILVLENRLSGLNDILHKAPADMPVYVVTSAVMDATCCDPLYRKAIRVSVGAALKIPFAFFTDTAGFTAMLAERGFQQFALSPRGRTDIRDAKPAGRLALYLGTEGEGLPESLLARLQTVRITMSKGFDSLNVAAASAIALHHFSHR